MFLNSFLSFFRLFYSSLLLFSLSLHTFIYIYVYVYIYFFILTLQLESTCWTLGLIWDKTFCYRCVVSLKRNLTRMSPWNSQNVIDGDVRRVSISFTYSQQTKSSFASIWIIECWLIKKKKTILVGCIVKIYTYTYNRTLIRSCTFIVYHLKMCQYDKKIYWERLFYALIIIIRMCPPENTRVG